MRKKNNYMILQKIIFEKKKIFEEQNIFEKTY